MDWLVQYAQTSQHILLNTHPSHTSSHTFLVHMPRLFCVRKNIAPLSRFHQSCADRGEVNEAILLVLYKHISRYASSHISGGNAASFTQGRHWRFAKDMNRQKHDHQKHDVHVTLGIVLIYTGHWRFVKDMNRQNHKYSKHESIVITCRSRHIGNRVFFIRDKSLTIRQKYDTSWWLDVHVA
jgi:hypothetical protein